MDRYRGIVRKALIVLGIALLVVLLLVTSCTPTAAVVPAQVAEVKQVSLSATEDSGLTEATVASGDGIQATIMKSCGCRLESFSGFGAVVKQSDQMKFAIFGSWALRDMGALDSILVVHPGDIVAYSRDEDDIMQAIMEAGALNIIKVTGKYIPGRHTLEIFGEGLAHLYLERLDTDPTWYAFLDENRQGQKYPATEGIRLAQLATE